MATRSLIRDLYDTTVGGARLGLGTVQRATIAPVEAAVAGGARVVDVARQGIATGLGAQLQDPVAAQRGLGTSPAYRNARANTRAGSQQAAQGLSGLRQRILGGIGAVDSTPAAAPNPVRVAPVQRAAADTTSAAAPAPAPQTGYVAPTRAEINPPPTFAAQTIAPPVLPRPAPEPRQNSFDITNTVAGTRYDPNATMQGPATAIPASLGAPAWGAGVAAAADGPGQLRIIPHTPPELDPTSRNFDPVAARFVQQQQQLDDVRALAAQDNQTRLALTQLGVEGDLARTGLAGQYGLAGQQLAGEAGARQAGISGQYGLQEQLLRAQGALDNTDLAGQHAQQVALINAQAKLDAAVAGRNPAQIQIAQMQLQQLQQLQAGGAPPIDVLNAIHGQVTPEVIVGPDGTPQYARTAGGVVSTIINDPAVVGNQRLTLERLRAEQLGNR